MTDMNEKPGNRFSAIQLAGSLAGAIILAAAAVAAVSWRIGPDGLNSDPRNERLEERDEDEDEDRDERGYGDRGERRDRRGHD